MRYLQPENGERILDLCAAPGGKTTHILEVAPQAQVMAVDIDEQRLSRVYDNLKRLGVKADVKQGDGRFPEQWCGNEQFDRILLDAPCSATGVIRRHPDIKWLRRDRDIAELAQAAGRDPQCHLDAPEARRHAGFTQPVLFCRKRTVSKLPPSSRELRMQNFTPPARRRAPGSKICRAWKKVMASFYA